ncbi:UPF0158 family protein [Haloplasma contractile]|uniref:Uncharacterized protein n=1 Tax=Haloplasma contractile SSD-17B TaxID=1033810 RepID=U2FDM5_9MOLU|nr:UPF0158 family protein [Haloplasma contractile]ERJ11080.1 hypothetical protein HLPCO_002901 [Haloplasma contractile SSD-17B]
MNTSGKAVNLEALADTMENMIEEHLYLLHKHTYEIVDIDYYYYQVVEENEEHDLYHGRLDWEKKVIEQAKDVFEHEDDYLAIPNQYDLNEYQMLKKFCNLLSEADCTSCLQSIQGKGAFRRFKAFIRHIGLENEWYKFRSEKIKEIATLWCKANGLPFNI